MWIAGFSVLSNVDSWVFCAVLCRLVGVLRSVYLRLPGVLCSSLGVGGSSVQFC